MAILLTEQLKQVYDLQEVNYHSPVFDIDYYTRAHSDNSTYKKGAFSGLKMFYDFYAIDGLWRSVGSGKYPQAMRDYQQSMPEDDPRKLFHTLSKPGSMSTSTGGSSGTYAVGGEIVPQAFSDLIDKIHGQVVTQTAQRLLSYLHMAVTMEFGHIIGQSPGWQKFRSAIASEYNNKKIISKRKFQDIIEEHIPDMAPWPDTIKRILKFSKYYSAMTTYGGKDVYDISRKVIPTKTKPEEPKVDEPSPEPEEEPKSPEMPGTGEPDTTDYTAEPIEDPFHNPEDELPPIPPLKDPTYSDEEDYWKKKGKDKLYEWYDSLVDSDSKIWIITEERLNPTTVQRVWKAMSKASLTYEDMVRAYNYMDWGGGYGTPGEHPSYGGKNWGAGVLALIKLIRTRSKMSTEDLVEIIDHIYDLEHNTGGLLNKGPMNVPEEHLNRRYRSQSIFRFLPYVSGLIKQLLIRYSKYVYGNSELEIKKEDLLNSPTKPLPPEEEQQILSTGFTKSDGNDYQAGIAFRNKKDEKVDIKYIFALRENGYYTIHDLVYESGTWKNFYAELQAFKTFKEALDYINFNIKKDIGKEPQANLTSANYANKSEKTKYIESHAKIKLTTDKSKLLLDVCKMGWRPKPSSRYYKAYLPGGKRFEMYAFNDGSYLCSFQNTDNYKVFTSWDDAFNYCKEATESAEPFKHMEDALAAIGGEQGGKPVSQPTINPELSATEYALNVTELGMLSTWAISFSHGTNILNNGLLGITKSGTYYFSVGKKINAVFGKPYKIVNYFGKYLDQTEDWNFKTFEDALDFINKYKDELLGNKEISSKISTSATITPGLYPKVPTALPPNAVNKGVYKAHVGVTSPPKNTIRLTVEDEDGLKNIGFNPTLIGQDVWYIHSSTKDTVKFYPNDSAKLLFVGKTASNISLKFSIEKMLAWLPTKYSSITTASPINVPTTPAPTGGVKVGGMFEKILSDAGFNWNDYLGLYVGDIDNVNSTIKIGPYPKSILTIGTDGENYKTFNTLPALAFYLTKEYPTQKKSSLGTSPITNAGLPSADTVYTEILEGLKQLGFAPGTTYLFPDVASKIASIKWLREYMSQKTPQAEIHLGLADAKWAVENITDFLDYIKENGISEFIQPHYNPYSRVYMDKIQIQGSVENWLKSKKSKKSSVPENSFDQKELKELVNIINKYPSVDFMVETDTVGNKSILVSNKSTGQHIYILSVYLKTYRISYNNSPPGKYPEWLTLKNFDDFKIFCNNVANILETFDKYKDPSKLQDKAIKLKTLMYQGGFKLSTGTPGQIVGGNTYYNKDGDQIVIMTGGVSNVYDAKYKNNIHFDNIDQLLEYMYEKYGSKPSSTETSKIITPEEYEVIDKILVGKGYKYIGAGMPDSGEYFNYAIDKGDKISINLDGKINFNPAGSTAGFKWTTDQLMEYFKTPEHHGITPDENSQIIEVVLNHGQQYWTEYITGVHNPYVTIYKKISSKEPASSIFEVGALLNYYQIDKDNKPYQNLYIFSDLLIAIDKLLTEDSGGQGEEPPNEPTPPIKPTTGLTEDEIEWIETYTLNENHDLKVIKLSEGSVSILDPLKYDASNLLFTAFNLLNSGYTICHYTKDGGKEYEYIHFVSFKEMSEYIKNNFDKLTSLTIKPEEPKAETSKVSFEKGTTGDIDLDNMLKESGLIYQGTVPGDALQMKWMSEDGQVLKLYDDKTSTFTSEPPDIKSIGFDNLDELKSFLVNKYSVGSSSGFSGDEKLDKDWGNLYNKLMDYGFTLLGPIETNGIITGRMYNHPNGSVVNVGKNGGGSYILPKNEPFKFITYKGLEDYLDTIYDTKKDFAKSYYNDLGTNQTAYSIRLTESDEYQMKLLGWIYVSASESQKPSAYVHKETGKSIVFYNLGIKSNKGDPTAILTNKKGEGLVEYTNEWKIPQVIEHLKKYPEKLSDDNPVGGKYSKNYYENVGPDPMSKTIRLTKEHEQILEDYGFTWYPLHNISKLCYLNVIDGKILSFFNMKVLHSGFVAGIYAGNNDDEDADKLFYKIPHAIDWVRKNYKPLVGGLYSYLYYDVVGPTQNSKTIRLTKNDEDLLLEKGFKWVPSWINGKPSAYVNIVADRRIEVYNLSISSPNFPAIEIKDYAGKLVANLEVIGDLLKWIKKFDPNYKTANKSTSILTPSEAISIINSELKLQSWNPPPHSYNNILYENNEILIEDHDQLKFAIGYENNSMVKHGKLWYIRQVTDKDEGEKYFFIDKDKMYEYIKKHIKELLTYIPIENEKEKETPTVKPKKQPKDIDTKLSGNAQHLSVELSMLASKSGFNSELNSKGVRYDHPCGHWFQIFQDGIYWSNEQLGAEEIKMQGENLKEYLRKVLSQISPQMNSEEVYNIFFNESIEIDDKLFNEMLDEASELNGHSEHDSEFVEKIKSIGFIWYPESNCYTNEEIYQIVVILPGGVDSKYRIFFINSSGEKDIFNCNTEKLLFELIGLNGKLNFYDHSKESQQSEQDEIKSSGESYKTHDDEANASLIQLNAHDQNLLFKCGFEWVPQENHYYKNKSTGDIIKFSNTGKGEFLEFEGKDFAIDIEEFDNIPHALKFIVIKYLPGGKKSEISKKEKEKIELSDHDYNTIKQDGVQKVVPLHPVDVVALEKIGFKYSDAYGCPVYIHGDDEFFTAYNDNTAYYSGPLAKSGHVSFNGVKEGLLMLINNYSEKLSEPVYPQFKDTKLGIPTPEIMDKMKTLGFEWDEDNGYFSKFVPDIEEQKVAFYTDANIRVMFKDFKADGYFEITNYYSTDFDKIRKFVMELDEKFNYSFGKPIKISYATTIPDVKIFSKITELGFEWNEDLKSYTRNWDSEDEWEIVSYRYAGDVYVYYHPFKKEGVSKHTITKSKNPQTIINSIVVNGINQSHKKLKKFGFILLEKPKTLEYAGEKVRNEYSNPKSGDSLLIMGSGSLLYGHYQPSGNIWHGEWEPYGSFNNIQDAVSYFDPSLDPSLKVKLFPVSKKISQPETPSTPDAEQVGSVLNNLGFKYNNITKISGNSTIVVYETADKDKVIYVSNKGNVDYFYHYVANDKTGKLLWDSVSFPSWISFVDFVNGKTTAFGKHNTQVPHPKSKGVLTKPKATGDMPYSGTNYADVWEEMNIPKKSTITLISSDDETMTKMGFEKIAVPGVFGAKYYKKGIENIEFYADGTAGYWPNAIINTSERFPTVKKALEFLWKKHSPYIKESKISYKDLMSSLYL